MSEQVHQESVAGSEGNVESQVSAGAEGAAAEGGAQGAAAGVAEGGEAAKEGKLPPGEGDEEPPAYKPREKFKVRHYDPAIAGADEKLQKEEAVPEWLRPLMKDEASEKQVIELLEKAYGLEPVKAERAQVRKERDEFKNNLNQVTQGIGELRQIYQRGDINLWLQKLSIPRERMLQWALDEVNYSQLPPEQQRLLDDRRDAQRQAFELEKQNSGYQSQVQEQARNAKLMLLDSGLERPDAKAFSDAYDAQMGKSGAFKEAVIEQGELAWAQQKRDLTPAEAIASAMARYKPFITASAAPGAQPGASGVLPPPAAKAGTIPNVQGKGSSPLKKSVRSIDDLKKLSKEMSAG